MEEKKKSTKGLLKRFLPFYKKHLPMLFFDIFCAVVLTACDLVLPMIVREITDTGMKDIKLLTAEFILRLGALYIILRIISCAANYCMASYGHIMGAKIETEMRANLFDKFQSLSFSYYDNVKVGELMSRITNDLFEVTELAHHGPEEVLMASVKIIGAFVILCTMSVPLTLIVFAVLPFQFFFAVYFNRRMRKQFKRQRRQIGELNAQIEDSLSGIRVVQSFSNSDIEREKFRHGNEGFLGIKRKAYTYMAQFEASNRFFSGLMYIAIVVAGGFYMMNETISAADLVAYLLYASTLISSVDIIVRFSEQYLQGMTGIERYYEIMDTPVEVKNRSNAVPLEKVGGDVEFRNVSFRYGSKENEVLSDINISVKAGENIAIVGPSGSGKTTLCSLVPRFYDIGSGEILIDGRNITDYTLDSLRENIGFVQQDVYLFGGTVFENIEYGKPGASRDEVIEAAKRAGAHDFIMAMPDGYDTEVGERGVRLSGGEKQRISIARTFLKNPPVLILDEATSSLDNDSERIVQNSLNELANGRTTITIAHRLTTIMNSTCIYVLTKEGIVEKGSHEKLLAQGGKYAELWGKVMK